MAGDEVYTITAAPLDWVAERRKAYNASVEIQNGNTGGSGTIIWIEQGIGFILTCRHLFNGNQGPGHWVKVRVPGQATRVDAKLIALSPRYDLASLYFQARPGMDYAPLCQDPTKPCRIGEPLWQFGYPVGHRGQDGPHHRTGVLQHEGVGGYLRISSGLRSGDSGGGVFRTDGALLGVGVWGSGGHVDNYQCSVFVNETCWPLLRKLLPRNWPINQPGGGGSPPSPGGGSQPKPPEPVPPGVMPPVVPPVVPPAPLPGIAGPAGPPGPAGKDGRDGAPGKDGISPDLAPLLAAIAKLNERIDKLQMPPAQGGANINIDILLSRIKALEESNANFATTFRIRATPTPIH